MQLITGWSPIWKHFFPDFNTSYYPFLFEGGGGGEIHTCVWMSAGVYAHVPMCGCGCGMHKSKYGDWRVGNSLISSSKGHQNSWVSLEVKLLSRSSELTLGQ